MSSDRIPASNIDFNGYSHRNFSSTGIDDKVNQFNLQY